MKNDFVPKQRLYLLFISGIILFSISSVFAQSKAGYSFSKFFDYWLLSRVWVSAIFSLGGLFLLWRGKLTQNLRLTLLSVIFFVFAVLPALPLGKIVSGMGLHPSPMCIVTKPFLFLNAGRAVPVIFLSLLASILILTVIGNKLFCGWACPIGAIQEMVYRVPLPRKFKIKLPFKITNIIRSAIFIIFVPLVFLIGLSIYDYFNPFEFLHWGFELYGLIAILIVLAGSLFIFRPFCYLFCPLGLITWLFEHISLVKIKVNHDLCTDCDVCVDDSPCPSMESILNQKKIIPDCHACGECLPLCPENAIKFKR